MMSRAPGLTPTQAVLLTTSVAVLMALMEPVLGHTALGLELRTYMTPARVEVTATGCEPTGRLMVSTEPVTVTLNSLTVSSPPLVTNTAAVEVLRKDS